MPWSQTERSRYLAQVDRCAQDLELAGAEPLILLGVSELLGRPRLVVYSCAGHLRAAAAVQLLHEAVDAIGRSPTPGGGGLILPGPP